MLDAWHRFTDSDAFRWFAKRGPGRTLFRSRAFKVANVSRNRVRARTAALRHPGVFAEVRTFCFFVGHNKSGSSLLGSLLDAHPDVILSDELDVLQYVEARFPREEIFHLVLKGAQAEARKGRVTARRLDPYAYWVPEGWQGRCRRALVVGDSTTGTSTKRIAARPETLERAQKTMGSARLKLVHVVRNPFDPISVMMVRGKRSFENSIEHYFTACSTLARIRATVGDDALRCVRYEDLVADTAGRLGDICGFLGVEPEPDYLARCAAIVRPAPDRSREMVPWEPRWIEVVQRRIADFDFLGGYTYEH